MSWKNRKDKDGCVLPYILAWLAIGLIAFVIFMAILVAILWFVEWLPVHCGWVGVLLFACVGAYLFYKYA